VAGKAREVVATWTARRSAAGSSQVVEGFWFGRHGCRMLSEGLYEGVRKNVSLTGKRRYRRGHLLNRGKLKKAREPLDDKTVRVSSLVRADS
jgi:hypothetical protein